MTMPPMCEALASVTEVVACLLLASATPNLVDNVGGDRPKMGIHTRALGGDVIVMSAFRHAGRWQSPDGTYLIQLLEWGTRAPLVVANGEHADVIQSAEDFARSRALPALEELDLDEACTLVYWLKTENSRTPLVTVDLTAPDRAAGSPTVRGQILTCNFAYPDGPPYTRLVVDFGRGTVRLFEPRHWWFGS